MNLSLTCHESIGYAVQSDRAIGFDDEGVGAQSWDLVRDGVFVGYRVDRVFAPKLGVPLSNGCSYADSPHHVPRQVAVDSMRTESGR